ncbi:MAG TPA: hypothetical protein VMZ52_05210 [Bryobacteraceae bacterium]|nr:hypothetical protein [Bryobacteraceae bacterium]
MRYIAMLACGFALLAAPQKNDEPERWLQTAIQAETVDGDLKSAIEQYKKIIGKASAGREVVAKALVRLGMCYERQGNAEARQQYEQAVREFADQTEAIAQAHERLAAMNGGGPVKLAALATRQLWKNQGGATVPKEIAPSADGRSLLFTHWDSGDLAIRDMGTGEIKRLGLKKSWTDSSDWAQGAVYSPDQRQVAYTWFSAADQAYQLRAVSTQPGAKPREILSVAATHPEIVYFLPFAWSSDGKGILTLTWSKKDNTSQIAWVSAADGSSKTLKSLGSRVGMASLSPDGRYIAYDARERKDSTDSDIFILALDGSSEAAAVQSPGIDSNPVWTPDGNHLIFTSNRSGNFGLYALNVQSGRGQGAPKLLKPNTGRIMLSGFARSGALYYRQPTGGQNVYLAELDPTTRNLRGAPAALAGAYAATNGMPALSPDGRYLAYLSTGTLAEPLSGGDGGGPGTSTVIVRSLESRVERAFPTDLDLREPPAWFLDGRALLLNARRQPKGTGRAFHKLDLDSGRVTAAFDPGKCCLGGGRMGLSRDGNTVYTAGLDESTGSQSVLAVNLSTAQVNKLYQTSDYVKEVALSPDGQSLAVVTTHTKPFAGSVLLMDKQGGAVRTLIQSPDLAPFSGIAWSSDGNDVYFGRSQTPPDWELWRLPVSGGEPSPTGIHGLGLREIHSGPNGALTYTAGLERQAELWAFDNLLPMLKVSR